MNCIALTSNLANDDSGLFVCKFWIHLLLHIHLNTFDSIKMDALRTSFICCLFKSKQLRFWIALLIPSAMRGNDHCYEFMLIITAKIGVSHTCSMGIWKSSIRNQTLSFLLQNYIQIDTLNETNGIQFNEKLIVFSRWHNVKLISLQ